MRSSVARRFSFSSMPLVFHLNAKPLEDSGRQLERLLRQQCHGLIAIDLHDELAADMPADLDPAIGLGLADDRRLPSQLDRLADTLDTVELGIDVAHCTPSPFGC